MKKVILIVLIIILFGFISSFSYWYILDKETKKIQEEILAPIETIKKTVLSSLKDRLEFCEIIKSTVTQDQGKFWLICNNRPFFVRYGKDKNGKELVNDELNGWNFLKSTDQWEDLQDCDFYSSEKNDQNYDLTFYCPKNFELKELKAKIYEFDVASLTMNKLEEKNFLDILDNYLASIYPFLSDCNLKGFELVPEWDIPTLSLMYSCQDDEWSVLTSSSGSLLPPILMNSNLSFEERAKISFEKSFDCEISGINILDDYISINSNCQNKELALKYDFLNYPVPFVNYQIDCQSPCLEFAKYFLAPPILEKEEAIFIKEKTTQTPTGQALTTLIYRIGDKIVNINLTGNKINFFEKKLEGYFYYYE